MTAHEELTFPRHCHSFLRQLAKHNDQAWFAANRERYHDQVLDPARAFVTAAHSQLRRLLPSVRADPRADGRGSISRIRRDTRFTTDKTPYRTFLGLLFWQDPHAARWERPAFHLVVRPGEIELTVGVRRFHGRDLEHWRDDCQDRPLHRLLQRLAQAGFEIRGEHYRRLPPGHTPTGTMTDDLRRYRGLTVTETRKIPVKLCGPDFLATCMATWKTLAPVNRWLNEALGVP